MTAPLVATIRLTGWKSHPMSDDGSCAGTYRTTVSRTQAIPPRALPEVKSVLSPARVRDLWHGPGFQYPDYTAPDFDFDTDALDTDVTGILLLNSQDQVVAEAQVDCHTTPHIASFVAWVEVPSLSEADEARLALQAKLLAEEAAEEARWDNFDSANSLREAAAALRRKISIARAARPAA